MYYFLIFNLTLRRRTGAIRTRATISLPLTPSPPLCVPTSVVVSTLPKTTTDIWSFAAAATSFTSFDVVELLIGVLIATAVVEMGAYCTANSDYCSGNGFYSCISSCPAADRLGMSIRTIGRGLIRAFLSSSLIVAVLVVTMVVVKVVVALQVSQMDRFRSGHTRAKMTARMVDDGLIPPTVKFGGACSPTCSCGRPLECSSGGGGGFWWWLW